MSQHVLVVFGTRPEAIKLFPVINRLKAERKLQVTVCATAQHRELLDQVLKLTNIVPDVDLDLMTSNQNLDQLTSRLLCKLGDVLNDVRPSRVVVQGDTATAMIGALASFYRKIPVSHVEAGLRSGDIYAPWPEEVNRKVISSIADQHFAPTQRAANALRKENIPEEHIRITGNTVIDALLTTRSMIEKKPELASYASAIRRRHAGRHLILVTCHRRENFGVGIQNIARALLTILTKEDVVIVLPAHPNPNVFDVLAKHLSQHPRVELIPPQEYVDFVSLLSASYLVLTDSGGVQEEAPTFGKPVLIMRETTERPEGLDAGTARLVGADHDRIVGETFRLLEDQDAYSLMSRAHNPFGDGHASDRIVRALLDG